MSGPAAHSSELRRLSVLIATCFVDMIGFAIVFPLMPFYALRLHATPLDVGLIMSAFSAAQILSAPMWGRVSDRYGRRPALLVGLLASAAAFVVFGLADTLWLLFVSRLIQGAGGGTTGVAQAYIADTVAPGQRARALGWLSAATSAGVMLGPAIGSSASNLGSEAPGFIAAALCLMNAGFAWRWLPESSVRDAAGATPARRPPVWHTAWEVVRHPARPVSRLVWIYGAGMLAFSALSGVVALYLGAEFGIDETTIGYVFFYQGGLSVVIRSLLLGPIVDRVGERWAMRLGTFSMIAGLILYPQPRSLWTLAVVMPLIPIGTALLFPSTTALVSRNTARADYGTVMGVTQLFGGLARVLAPILATAAFQHLGHPAPFYAAAAVVGLVSLLAFRVETPSHTVEGTPASATEAPS
ncbi:MAG TPA: MFS transporter [Gemmatimonadales bacterium]|nr:MFS transporter [Gemmatimonadales bacterium]